MINGVLNYMPGLVDFFCKQWLLVIQNLFGLIFVKEFAPSSDCKLGGNYCTTCIINASDFEV